MIEYILLIFSFILPIWYRYFFWFSSLEKYKGIQARRDKSNIFHIFIIVEVLLFILSTGVFIQSAFEFIVFNLVFYYGLLSSVFVIGKIFRGKLKSKIKNKSKYYMYLTMIFFVILLTVGILFLREQFQFLYIFILGIIIFSPLISFIIMNLFFKKIVMKKVAILTGGPGLEREIAFKSADFFKKYINREYDVYDLPNQMTDFLIHKDEYEFAIPVFHGEYGEDGKIFAFLDSLNVPHTFSDYKTHAICLDKEKTNTLVFQLGIKVPFQYIAQTSESFPESYPVIMKPNQGGSSFHTYKINNNQEFYDSYNNTRKDLKDDILIQQFIAGEEYSVPVVDGEILPVMKLEKDVNQLFDYKSKYESENNIKETFPEIEKVLLNKLQENSQKIYEYFKIKGMTRIDYLVLDNEVYFLEINTIPGMTEASILPKAWNLTGKTNEELVKKLIYIK